MRRKCQTKLKKGMDVVEEVTLMNLKLKKLHQDQIEEMTLMKN